MCALASANTIVLLYNFALNGHTMGTEINSTVLQAVGIMRLFHWLEFNWEATMGRGREGRLLESFSAVRLLLTLLKSSSESSFRSSLSFTPSLPPSFSHFCLCMPALSFAPSLSLVLTVYGQNRIRPVFVLCRISDWAPRLLEMMLLSDNRVSQRRAQSHPSNLQLNSAQFALRCSCVTHTHTHRWSNRIILHTSAQIQKGEWVNHSF